MFASTDQALLPTASTFKSVDLAETFEAIELAFCGLRIGSKRFGADQWPNGVAWRRERRK